MIHIINFYDLDNLLKKGSLKENAIHFSFEGIKGKVVVSCFYYGDGTYKVLFNEKPRLTQYKSKGNFIDFVELVKNQMKIKGFKTIINTNQLSLDIDRASNQLSLNDIEDSKSRLYKNIVSYCKGKDLDDIKRNIDLFHTNKFLFRKNIETYIEDELGYVGKVQLEDIIINENHVITSGLFRKKKVSNKDYQSYLADNCPEDVAEIKLTAKDIFKIIVGDM